MPTIKQSLMEELEYRLNSALNYPVSNEELGNFVPYNSTDEGCRELETIIELVSKSFDKAIVKAKEEERRKVIEKLKKVSYFEADSIDRNGYKTQSVKVGRGAYQLIHKSQIDDLIEALSKKEL